MLRWLRAQATHPDMQFSSHTSSSQLPLTPVPGDTETSSPQQQTSKQYIDLHTSRQNTYTLFKNYIFQIIIRKLTLTVSTHYKDYQRIAGFCITQATSLQTRMALNPHRSPSASASRVVGLKKVFVYHYHPATTCFLK